MAIAETELKKSDADDTSTAGSKETFATDNKEYPGSSSAKMYRLYSNLKGFVFSMPDGWDDRNIGIFLECCRECIEDFQVLIGNDENKLWYKIAKLGAEKSGSTTCFTVNSCLELAQCLKGYVLKNEKRIDNEAFKGLYNDVTDLLQYFPTPAEITNKTVCHRSRSKSTEKKSDNLSKNITSVESESSALSQKDHRTHQVESLIITYCQQDARLFGMPKTPVTYIWNRVSQKIYENIGIKVDVKKKLDTIKRNIAKEVKKETDKKSRAKKFVSLARPYLQFFDYMPPRTIKKKDFLGGFESLLKTDSFDGLEFDNEPVPLKGDNLTPVNDTFEYVHKKRRFSKTTEAKKDSNTSPPQIVESRNSENTTMSDEAYNSDLVKVCSNKSGDSVHNLNEQEVNNSENQLGINLDPETSPHDKFQFPDSSLIFSGKNISDSAGTQSGTESKMLGSTDTDSGEGASNISSSALSDHNVTTTTTWVKDVASPSSPGSDAQNKSKPSSPNRTHYSSPNESLRLEEDPDTVFFDPKYPLRGLRDNIKCYKPRLKKKKKPGPKGPRKVQNVEKRILPQRSAKRKTTNYNISEDEKSPPPVSSNRNKSFSPNRSPSPTLKGFPESSSLSPISPPFSPITKKRVYTGRIKKPINEEPFSESHNEHTEIVPLPKKRNTQRNNIPKSYPRSIEGAKPFETNRSEYDEEETPHLEQAYGLKRKANIGSEDESSPPKRNPTVMLEHFHQVGADRPPISPYGIQERTQVNPLRFNAEDHHQGAPTMKPSGLTGIAARHPVAHSPDHSRVMHHENVGAPLSHHPVQPSSSGLHFQNQNAVKPTSLKSSNHLREQMAMFEDMDASTLAILERHKNSKMRELLQGKGSGSPAGQAQMSRGRLNAGQLVPPSIQAPINQTSAVYQTLPAIGGQSGTMELVSSPPEWFSNFVNNYKKHDVWKMSMFLKTHQELLDIENKKLAMLKKIYEILDKGNS
ncbi:hypothetical protein AAG570_010872 [Ranatra chinensis]|uniref:Uncharacterized protein n=1 Tax=Ranatra chinensis TaxID=642074 RepID=A0ABD0YL30_9HEMI